MGFFSVLSEPQPQRTAATKSLQYRLFAYGEEMRNRRRRNHLDFIRAKIALTDHLISETMRNVLECSEEEFLCMDQQMIYSKILANQSHAMWQQEQQGVINPAPERALALNSFEITFNCNYDFNKNL